MHYCRSRDFWHCWTTNHSPLTRVPDVTQNLTDPKRLTQNKCPLNIYMNSMTRFWNLFPTKKTNSEFQKCIYRNLFLCFLFTSHTRISSNKKRSDWGPQEPIHVLHAKVRVITTDFFLGPVDVVHWYTWYTWYTSKFGAVVLIGCYSHECAAMCNTTWLDQYATTYMYDKSSFLFFFGWCMWIYVVYNLCIYLFV